MNAQIAWSRTIIHNWITLGGYGFSVFCARLVLAKLHRLVAGPPDLKRDNIQAEKTSRRMLIDNTLWSTNITM